MSAPGSRPLGRSRPLTARMRPDLCCVPQVHGGETVWIVKDPVALQYSAFGCEEFALLQLLNGRRTPQQVCRDFERLFVPRRLALPHLGEFVARMHSLGLLVSDAPGQGRQVLDRRQRKRRWSTLQSLLSILAIRFRGVDADRFLESLERAASWAFRPWFLFVSLCLMACALLAMLTQPLSASELWRSQAGFFSSENLLPLMAAIAIAKILHELGHGIACKHFGGECHEIGVMLLVFVPCLYCNVSDSWMIPGKWRRIAVSGAGIFVELLLASMCVFFWKFSEPGLGHQIALNIVLICSFNTLLLNGNPLLRYDGYYILSDLWGIPNLAQQSRTALGSAAQRLIGIDPGPDDIRPDRRRLLVGYGLLSGAYRLFVLAVILWMLHQYLAPRGFGSLAFVVGLITIGSTVTAPTIGVARRIRQPSARRPLNGLRFLLATIVAAAALAACLMLPAPRHVAAPFVIQPVDAHPVYAVMSGRLVRAAGCGDSVNAGDVIAQLENIDLDLQIAELSGRTARQTARWKSLESRRDSDPLAAHELPEAREAVTALNQQLNVLQRNRERLTLTADTSGIVIPPPAAGRESESAEPATGALIDAEHYGRSIPAGSLLCLVGDPQQIEAIVLVDEDSVAELQNGQPVRLRADSFPGRTLSGVVTQVSRQTAGSPQANVPSWSRLLSDSDAPQAAEQQATRYEARIALDQPDPRLRIGGRGAALITVRSETLGSRLYRSLRQLFGLRI